MKWLHVSSDHHATQGGVGRYIASCAEAGATAGEPITLVTRVGGRPPREARVIAVECSDDQPPFAGRLGALRAIERVRPYRYALWSVAAARRLLADDLEADVIEFPDGRAEGYAAICSGDVRRRWGTSPMIVYAHTPMFLAEALCGMDLLRFGRSIYHEWERRALNAADGVIAPSCGVLDALQINRPSAVIPPVVPECARPVRTRSERSIVLAGAVWPIKGVDIWARSLNDVLRAHRDVSAILVGKDTPTGPDGSSMVEHVIGLIDEPLRDRFRWTGPLAVGRVQQIIDEAAMVIVPSLLESFSFVAAEAIMRACPVLISDRTGIGEHLPMLPTFPVGDVAALAEAQRAILDDPAGAAEWTHEARQTLQALCHPDRVLHLRRQFAAGLSVAPARDPIDVADDGLVEMESFLEQVDAAERLLLEDVC